MEILIVIAVAISNIVCFYVGAKIGQQTTQGKEIQAPDINPMRIYRAQQERKEAEREQKRLDVILRNIETYDGTASGQQDIPS